MRPLEAASVFLALTFVAVTATAGEQPGSPAPAPPAPPPPLVGSGVAPLPLIPPRAHADALPGAEAEARRLALTSGGRALLGLGAFGLALGAATGIAAIVQRGHILERCPDGLCQSESTLRAYRTTTTLSTSAFVAGGALATTGIVLLVVARRSPSAPAPALAPLVGPGFVGLVARFP